MFRIDARRSQEHKLLDTITICSINDIRLNHKIVVDKLCLMILIAYDPTNLSGGKKNIIWFCSIEI